LNVQHLLLFEKLEAPHRQHEVLKQLGPFHTLTI
jgi:hypothetical protein